MTLEWIASPLTLTALLAAAMVACIALFLTLKKEIGESEARRRHEAQAMESVTDQMRTSLESLRLALQESERQAATAARPITAMNLSTRGQVLRLHRRGEKPEQIAAALSIPLSEVDLLVKVHRSVIGQL